jgi:nitronate monooxygenase
LRRTPEFGWPNNGKGRTMIRTRLTKLFNIEHPIILAPMTPAAGADLSTAVAAAGGLGLLGGGYGDRTWFETESAKITRSDVGCGFITWSVAKQPELLDFAIERHPRAIMLSFADPAPFAKRIKQARVPLICQVHTVDQARRAADVGADVVVAQGTEAGGHGQTARSTLPFVPTVVDALSKHAPDVVVVAAGGIADGRGLAAALMLGAEGALMGSRFWATKEALRTSVYDIVRKRAWPEGYTGRLMKNEFIEKWHGHEEKLRALQADELEKVEAASRVGDFDVANVTVGESIGMIHDLPEAGDVVRRVVAEAKERLAKYARVSRIDQMG